MCIEKPVCVFIASLTRFCCLILLLPFTLASSFAQTTYYVAANGNDFSDGRSASTPFQTIARINRLQLQPGDQVLFQRNDTFQGSLQIKQSGVPGNPIVFDAYGSGNKPILAGSAPVSNWTNIGNNVWRANCPACGDRVTGLYRNGTSLPLGRYPNLSDANKGYLTVQSHSGKSGLTSQQSLPANFTGGEAVYRPVQWILNRAKITSQSGNTLSLVESGNYDVSDGWGFFVQNHPATLDQTGEWYYDSGSRTVQLYDNQSNPNNQSISATASDIAVQLISVSFVTIRNLRITQAVAKNLSAGNSSNIIISGNDIAQGGENGLAFEGAGSELLIENNQIDDINNNGVIIDGYSSVTFRGNSVRNIALIPGRGKSGDGNYVGMQSFNTTSTLIENNVLDNIGYVALNFSNNTTIQRNQISNFCLTKSDGSGLYIFNGNRQPMSNIHLKSNIVYNGIGSPEGTPGGSYSGANGIYLDDCTTNIEVADNTVYNCRGYGIFLHGSSNITVTGNTSFDNGEGQFYVTNAGECRPRNNIIQNNIFFSRLADQTNVKYESNIDDLGSFGQFENNVYARPFNDATKISTYNGSVGATLSLVDWQNRYGRDRSSNNSPLTYSSGDPNDYIKFVANPTNNAIQAPLSGSYRDARNKSYTDYVVIPAFSSVVLLRENTTPPPPTTNLRDAENPANAVAGLDYQYYEGSWSSLPNFDALPVVKTGTVNQPTLSVRNRDDNYAVRYRGYVSVPTDGVYTFYTTSDDGSKLLIGSTEVVNNDGGHAEQERSGTIGLKAGVHALSVLFFQGGGGQALTVSYSGPGVDKQLIGDGAYRRVSTGTTTPPPPTTNLRDAENPANAVAGLDYQYYEGSWSSLPNFDALPVVKTGTVNQPTLSVRNRDDNYAVRYRGYVSVPTDGVYTFYTTSDDGSKLLIGSTEVVNNDGGHAEQERSGTIGLKAGVHALSVLFFQGGGGQALTVSYSGPGVDKQLIGDGAYRRVSTGTTTPPPPTTNLRDAENPANAVAGLDYQYYEGSWSSLPNFDALPVVKTGTVNQPTLSVRNRDDNYAVRYRGYVSVPTDGVYTFYTTSDDGSKLLIGSTEVVNNDGGHAEQERSGTIGLKAGVHALSVLFFQGGGGQALTVSYSGPGVGKQLIGDGAYRRVSTGTTTPPPPTTNLRDAENPANAVAGLDYQYYEGSWSSLPNFDALPVVKTGTVNQPTLSVRNRDDNYAVRYRGYVSVPTDGVYTFYTTSDDGSKLLIGSTEVVSNDGIHAEQERSGTIGLKAGVHALSVLFFQGGGGQALTVSYSGPGVGKQLIGDGAYRRVSTGTTTPGGNTATGTGTGLRADYFNNVNVAAPVVLSRIDATVNFEWSTGSPAASINADYFSARWSGQVEAPVTGSYTFSTNTDDGVRLWVNGVMLIDDWSNHPAKMNTGPSLALNAGQKYDIRMDYYENVQGAVAQLLWAYPGQAQQVVPQVRLYPAASSSGGRLGATDYVGEDDATVEIFPIPASDEIWVRYYADVSGEVTLQVVDMLGRSPIRTIHPVAQGPNLFRVAVTELTRGYYVVSLTQGQWHTTRRVLLAK